VELTLTPADTAEWLVLCAGNIAALVRTGGKPELSHALWEAIRQDGGVQLMLDALARNGLAAVPDFALLDWTDGTATGNGTASIHAIVRGAATVRVQTPTGETTMDAAGMSTWNEKSYPGAFGFVVEAPSEHALSELPMVSGAAWAVAVTGTVQSDGERSDATALAAAAAPEQQPEPEPEPKPEPKPAPVVLQPPPPPPAISTPPVAPPPAIPSPPIAQLPEQTLVEKPAMDDGGYDHLFEETVVRSIEDAAVRPEEPDEVESGAAEHDAKPPAVEGDHDGLTVTSADLAKLRGRRGTSPGPASPPPAPAAPRYFLDLSTGSSEALTQPVLVGRSPSVTKVPGGLMPRLVTIAGDADISRNHAQFMVEGDTVVVTDLHSRNGTTVILPGQAPRLLRQGEPTAVLSGTIVDLGSGITLTVREA
jgi:hypothetical protein